MRCEEDECLSSEVGGFNVVFGVKTLVLMRARPGRIQGGLCGAGCGGPPGPAVCRHTGQE